MASIDECNDCVVSGGAGYLSSQPQLETISGTVVARLPDSHPAIIGRELALCLICATDQPEPSFRRDGTSM